MSLLTRLALWLLVAGLVPLALAIWLLVRINDEALEEGGLRSQAAAAQAAAGAIDSHLEARRDLAATLAAQPGLIEEQWRDDLAAVLEPLMTSVEDVVAVVAVDAEDAEAFRAQRRDAARAIDDLLQQRREGMGEDGLTNGVSAREGDGLGFLVIEEQIPETAGAHLLLVLDRQRLELVISDDPTFDDVALSLVDEVGRVIAGSDFSDRISRDVLSQLATNRAAAESNQLSVLGTIELGSRIAAYAAVPGTSWFVLSQQSTDRVFAVRDRMLRSAAGAGVLATALVGLVLALAWVSVVRPLRRVLAAQRELAGLETSGRGDEIAELESAFATLQEKWRDGRQVDQAVLDRYEIREVLGGGAMGLVFRAFDPRLRREIALKTIQLDDKLSTEQREEQAVRLVEEAAAMANLSDPNVVQVYDARRAGGSAFLAMELVPGISLEQYLRRNRTLSIEQALLVAESVAAGLAAAHGAGLVHQDIKPGNILLTRDGRVKVTDFGVANVVNRVAGDAKTVYGTPGYLPPEALEGKGTGMSGDLFALGVVLYQSLGGARPYRGGTISDVVRATMKGERRPLRELRPDVPTDLEALIDLLLGKRHLRPETAAEVAEAVGRIRRAREAQAGDRGESATEQLEETKGEPSDREEGSSTTFVTESPPLPAPGADADLYRTQHVATIAGAK